MNRLHDVRDYRIVWEMPDISERTIKNGIDYELDDEISTSTVERMKALGNPLRLLVADLVLERAMTVSELADRVGRPRGSVAHHVDVLVNAGLLKVVRTRRVRAIEERFYGRSARTFVLDHGSDHLPFVREAIDQVDSTRSDLPTFSTFRHARVAPDRVQEYIDRLKELSLEFSTEARDGDTEYGMLLLTFPTNRPVSQKDTT
jgi:DNA-binding transcriptional ArsR family regulator